MYNIEIQHGKLAHTLIETLVLLPCSPKYAWLITAYRNTVYHETFVAGNFRGFCCFLYHCESFMPNNLHHRHNR